MDQFSRKFEPLYKPLAQFSSGVTIVPKVVAFYLLEYLPFCSGGIMALHSCIRPARFSFLSKSSLIAHPSYDVYRCCLSAVPCHYAIWSLLQGLSCAPCCREGDLCPKRMGWFSQIGVVKTYRPEYFYFYAKFLRLLMVFIQLGGPRGISVHVVWTGPLSFRHQLTFLCMSYKFSNFM